MIADNDRQAAIQQIADLVQRFDISVGEITAWLEAAGHEQPVRRARILGRLLSYLGATFVFAGMATFIALQWDNINSAGRVIITLGPGIVAFVLAILSLDDDRFRKAATPMFIIAAILEPTGMMVAFDEFASGGDWRVATLVTSASVGLQFGAAYLRCHRAALALLGLVFATVFWITALDKLGVDDEWIALAIGAALVLVGIQIHRGAHAAISPFIFLFGSWSLLWGVFDVLEKTALEVMFLAAASGMTWLGIEVRSRTLNFTSTIAILAYIGYFTARHFADSSSWPLALIVFGMALIGISSLALRIDRKVLRSR